MRGLRPTGALIMAGDLARQAAKRQELLSAEVAYWVDYATKNGALVTVSEPSEYGTVVLQVTETGDWGWAGQSVWISIGHARGSRAGTRTFITLWRGPFRSKRLKGHVKINQARARSWIEILGRAWKGK